MEGRGPDRLAPTLLKSGATFATPLNQATLNEFGPEIFGYGKYSLE